MNVLHKKQNTSYFVLLNTNLPPILHRFRNIAFDRSKIAMATPLAFSPCLPTKGFPCDDLRKIICGCQWMTKVPNGVETVENFNRLSRAHERYSFFRSPTDNKIRTNVLSRNYLAYACSLTACICKIFNVERTVKLPYRSLC